MYSRKDKRWKNNKYGKDQRSCTAEFEKAKSKLTSNARTQLNSVETPAEIVAILTKLYRIPFLKETKQFLSLADYNQVLRLIIIDSGIASSPSERAQFKADVLELFDESFVPQFFMAGIRAGTV